MAEQSWRKGPWTSEEDKLLVEYVSRYGDGRWSCVSKCAGLNRSGKSCRLRWVNYLRPGLKKGHITPQEEGIIIELHALWGNKWSTIARYLPGRTDNEIKNYWRTHFKKRKRCDQKHQQERKDSKSISSGSNHEAAGREGEEGDGKKESAVSESTTSRESDHPQLTMMMPAATHDQQNYSSSTTACCWSDFVPADNYMFAGLWDVDDQNGCSKTMAIQGQANIAAGCVSSRGGGDPVKYMCSSSGGYIF